MDPSALEIHIALTLLPYLDATDVCRVRGVNKHWNELFSSPDLLRAAIRIYGSASREYQIITRLEKDLESGTGTDELAPKLTPEYYQSLFRNFSIRTQHLRKGTPIQEIRLPLRKNASNNFVYAIADDVLVYVSPLAGGLEVIFWNHDLAEYSNMRLELGTNNMGAQPSAYSVRRLRVFEDILVIEHTKEGKLENVTGSFYTNVVQIFRLISPFAKVGVEPQDGAKRKASYEQLSLFETFKYRHVNYTEGIVSDHSSTHYAALSNRSNSLRVGLFVWDIFTGKMVFRYEQEALGTRGFTSSPLVPADKVVMVDDSHVLLIKPDLRNGVKFRKHPEETAGFKVYIKTLPITVGTVSEEGGPGEGEGEGEGEDGIISASEEDIIHSTITRDKDDEMLQSYHDYIQFRVVRQRAPKLHHHDNPKVSIYLNLWGRTRITKLGKVSLSRDEEEWSRRPVERNEIHQYELITSPPLPGQTGLSLPAPGELQVRAIYTAINDKLPSQGFPDPDPSIPKPSMSDIPIDTDSAFFLNSNGTDALSFDMVWSGGSTECLGTRLMTFYFGIRSFQLTETSSAMLKRGRGEPLRYHLDYSSYLKVSGEPGEPREIPSVQRNVLATAMSHRGTMVPFDVHGDERMSIYTEPRPENAIADLVMCVWGSDELKLVKSD
ncbi:hypothetical protein EYR41_003013 [Orbilia oligospora]|uniref:F-box domain-containing protein n=1 Tax=Orbilia oligospora TaxID=2813651 RepID=A0A8H2E5E5_ORBOL|nr:hypothetical protein EYR41_003013 [Orbilia oligospora]